MIIESLSKITQLPTPAMGFLPAVHDATVDEVTSVPADVVAAKGKVYKNTHTGSLDLPAAAKWPARQVAKDAHFASDGRLFYGIVNKPETNSWYPTAFERVLYTIPFTLEMLPIGGSYRLDRQFDFRTIGAISPVVWSVIFEIGMRTDETEPDPVGPNIEAYTWLPPLLEQQIPISEIATSHVLGIQLRHTADGFEGDQFKYSKALAATEESLPDEDNFALRVRLGQLDILDDTDPRGHVAFYVGKPSKSS